MIIDGLFDEKGVFPPELIGKHENCFDYILNYLKDRGVDYEIIREVIYSSRGPVTLTK